ncbi:hypothetical protein [Sphingomonas nostoxanthinifaciens]|uniref:hypothetical protein n=1 Tax=Sphingomonas nostoxanthinifaciens TaxID=2872652 RepID=UPI001CC1CD97|nr:hypothetical protein [Sphingomonas nostoxanthinifaciens]UAK26160.1 hypothetical protein K8P63_08705 [Sphingomonas nostoxanthinifaciens]
MYSESDIEAAVATGAISPAAAAALRASVARDRGAPSVDEESFRLVTGFNDIFVTIAALLLLIAVGWIGATLLPLPDEPGRFGLHMGGSVALGGACVAAASWGLAEYFTRVRRMALPSIVLLGGFVWGVAVALFGMLTVLIGHDAGPRVVAVAAALSAFATALAAFLHWRRFHVPITVAALTIALAVTVMALMLAVVPGISNALLWIMLAAGLGVFGYAMHWDMSDRTRTTRRSDVAFWLHLAAAPMIVHPVFWLLGGVDSQPGVVTALAVLLLYLIFGLVALAVDRRALLVSSLAYVLTALGGLFHQFGAISLNMAFTALVIGSALLMLSAFWHGARRLVVMQLPEGLRAQLPALDRVVSPRPA